MFKSYGVLLVIMGLSFIGTIITLIFGFGSENDDIGLLYFCVATIFAFIIIICRYLGYLVGKSEIEENKTKKD